MAASTEPTAVHYGPPLKPRKGLAYGLLALFAVWMVALWVTYFTSVYPASHDHGAARPVVSAPAEQTVPR